MPKIDYNSFLQLQRDILERIFKNGVVSGDCGFSVGKKIFDSVEFVVPFSKPVGRPKKGQHKEERMLSRRQEKWNCEMRAVRARVELPYALLKNRWKALGVPFRDGTQAQDHLVRLAVAFHNGSL